MKACYERASAACCDQPMVAANGCDQPMGSQCQANNFLLKVNNYKFWKCSVITNFEQVIANSKHQFNQSINV